jgi:uncharacterized protein GlcG (DUF336 family)
MNRYACLAAVVAGALAIGACHRQPQGAEDTSDTAQRADSASNARGTVQPGGTDRVVLAGQGDKGNCGQLPNAKQLQEWLAQVPNQGEVGGLAGGQHEWAALVDRSGRLCVITTDDADPSAPWPGSQGIAKAKAFTANAFSSDQVPMSTARLYTMSQPGRSLWGAGAGDPLNPKCLNPPDKAGGVGEFCGGVITFGGGVPLYRNQTRVGGLGLSGDTPCADHEIAKRIRTAAKLDPAKGPTADDITYSGVDGPSIYSHPLCPNTWRNGKKIGDAPPARGY